MWIVENTNICILNTGAETYSNILNFEVYPVWLMENNGFKLIAFDMDGVLTTHPSSWRFVHERLGVDNQDNLQRYRSGELDYSRFLDSDLFLWLKAHPGISKSDVMSILREIPVRKDLAKAVNLIREAGARAVIISGGISWLCDILNEIVEFDDSYANIVNTDSSGAVQPHGTVVVVPRSKDTVLQKVQQKYGISPENTVSVGDSLFDSAMFRYSGKGVAFNSNSRELDSIADLCIETGKLTDLYMELFGR